MRSRLAQALLLASLVALPGCEGEVAALLALLAGAGAGAWMVGRDRRFRALHEAEGMRHALASGNPRDLEFRLRRRLALKEAGEAVSAEREWLARAQLGGLLVAEWRLDEAREVYGDEHDGALSEGMAALARFGRHELAILREGADANRLEQIRADKERSLAQVPGRVREVVAAAWEALEGLCLARMDRAREASELLEGGMRSLAYNPARVVYLFHFAQALESLGERERAEQVYAEASSAFPGTRLANEAQTRQRALAAGDAGGFRSMLPAAPIANENDEDEGAK